MRCWHVEETAGGQVIFTLPPPFLTDLFTRVPDLKFEPRIRSEVPADVMARLRKVPYFNAGYEPDGLTPREFNRIPALLSTMKQFHGAMDKIAGFTSETLSAAKTAAMPA